MQVNILEAKNRLSRLVKAAAEGEEVIIANRGQPVARLVAASPPKASSLPPRLGEVSAWLESRRLPRHARRSVDEIDAAIAQERAAWD